MAKTPEEVEELLHGFAMEIIMLQETYPTYDIDPIGRRQRYDEEYARLINIYRKELADE